MFEAFYGELVLDRPLSAEHRQVLEDFNQIQHDGTDTPYQYCQWVPNEDGTAIEWDGGEKFYYFYEWMIYLVNQFIKPWGYVLSGEIAWEGDFNTSRAGGILYVQDNQIEKVEDVILNPGPSWAKRDRIWQGEGKYS